jgi:hypothetical protein
MSGALPFSPLYAFRAYRDKFCTKCKLSVCCIQYHSPRCSFRSVADANGSSLISKPIILQILTVMFGYLTMLYQSEGYIV